MAALSLHSLYFSLLTKETVITTEVTFGFVPDTYTVSENERWVVFSVSLVSGILTKEVVIEFFTEDGSGSGEIQSLLSNTMIILELCEHIIQYNCVSKLMNWRSSYN